MKKKIVIGILSCFWILKVSAHHIIGGEMYYSYQSQTGSTVTYEVVLKLYRGCEPIDMQHADFDPFVQLTIYDKDVPNPSAKVTPDIAMSDKQTISHSFTDPCIDIVPTTCYQVAYYRTTITLPVNQSGYIITYQRCCRSDLILNAYTQAEVGATYYTEIPGAQSNSIGSSSPIFSKEEAILICANSKFEYDYSATMGPGLKTDSIRYEFVPAYDGGNQREIAPVPAAPPPYQPLSYIPPYTASSPLGEDVTIDPHTGIISGRAPATGTYVVAVEASAYRNGKIISRHRKDFHIEVTDCHKKNVALVPDLIMNCDSLNVSFPNSSTTGKNYRWDFGDGSYSTEYAPVHAYRDTGTYLVKLSVDTASSCGDSTVSTVKVYPVLKEDFSSSQYCLVDSTHFLDLSTSTNKDIVDRRWDFGDGNTAADTSHETAPAYQYKDAGIHVVNLSVTTDKGCSKTLSRNIEVYDKPPLRITPADTLMCYKDQLSLKAESSVSGSFAWAPLYDLNGGTTATPKVMPQADTTYYVRFTDGQGCENIDSTHIKVVRQLTISAGNDTTLCQGDLLPLHASSDEAYAFSWYDGAGNLAGTGRGISLNPLQSEQYRLVASIGTCVNSDEMNARVVPYPAAFAGNDTSICYGDIAVLHASGGAFYQWTPADSLSDADNPFTYANPLQTTIYTVTVTDTLGCPKPVSDSMVLSVIPPVNAFAGNDTIIATGQLLQLHATGGTYYAWSPPDGLNDPSLADPVTSSKTDIEYKVKVSTPEGCFAYDSINIRYITGPEIYVPNAFSPNGDGKNDVFRPIPVGITEIAYFRIFDRWGNEVYETKDYLQGWNGYYKGKPADAGTYVWEVSGKDFNGRAWMKKGTVVLIR